MPRLSLRLFGLLLAAWPAMAHAQRQRFPSQVDRTPLFTAQYQGYGTAPGQVILPANSGDFAPTLSPAPNAPTLSGPALSPPAYASPSGSYGAPQYSAPNLPNPTAPPYGAAPTYAPPSYPGAPSPPFGGAAAPTYNAPSLPSSPSYTPPGGFDPYASPSAPTGPYNPYSPSPYAPIPGGTTYPGGSYPGAYNPAAPFGQQPSQPWFGGGQSWLGNGASGTGEGNGWFSDTFGADLGQQVREPMRFLQETRARFTYLADFGGSKHLNVDDAEISATFAVPFFYEQAPILITPGFATHWWNGPTTAPPSFAELSPHTYDAFVDGSWQPQISPWFSANVGVRVGAYTDFNTISSHSLRIMGRGLGIATVSPTVQIAAGVVYLDRLRVKILPAGGVIWSPSSDARYEIVFPNPRLMRKVTTWNEADIWGLIGGEYGGGSWTFIHAGGAHDQFDYNDIRVYLGFEGYGQRGWKASADVGYAFRRQLIFRSGMPSEFVPGDTLMLRAGLSY